MNKNITVSLTYPVTYNNVIYKEVTLKSPKVKDLKSINFEVNSMSENIKLIAVLSGVPDLAIEELEFSDYVKLQEVAVGFFREPQETMKS